jgi:hypothetical protein
MQYRAPDRLNNPAPIADPCDMVAVDRRKRRFFTPLRRHPPRAE